jgi:thiol-disulfide isomerase/thioredoxin
MAGVLAIVLLSACDREPAVSDPAPPTAEATTGGATSAPDDASSPQPPRRPDTPRLNVTTVDGTPYDLAGQRGKWVVVNFWATWCKPCLKEMPELSALDAMREHIEVIGLAYEEIEVAEMKAFLEKHPVVYPIAILDTYEPPADFDTPRGLPMTYLVDPQGKVADQFIGPVTAHEIEAAIEQATGKGGADA